MKPSRRGQVVKFHTPFEYEDPNQLFIILEFIEDGDRSRATVQAINTGLSMPSIHLIRAKDLEVDEVETRQLARYLEVLKNKGRIDEQELNLRGIEWLESLKMLSF